jgi:hypothetical protein
VLEKQGPVNLYKREWFVLVFLQQIKVLELSVGIVSAWRKVVKGVASSFWLQW